jgi:excinuclease ABC subunit A
MPRAITAVMAWPSKGTLFLFDEPTTGLHFRRHRQADARAAQAAGAGHSLMVIEHNLDVIRAATG